jgi:hypothetical protein
MRSLLVTGLLIASAWLHTGMSAIPCNLNGVQLTTAHTTHAHSSSLKRPFCRPKILLTLRNVHFYAEEVSNGLI